MSFLAKKHPVEIKLFLPMKSHYFEIISEHFVSKDYHITLTEESGNRLSTWNTPRASPGSQHLFYRLVLKSTDHPSSLQGLTLPPPMQPPKNQPLRSNNIQITAAEALLADYKKQSNTTPMDPIRLTQDLIGMLRNPQNDNARILVTACPDSACLAKQVHAILALNHLPSEIIHGIILDPKHEETKDLPMETYLTVWNPTPPGQWKVFNLQTGRPIAVESLLTLWQHDVPWIQSKGTKNLKTALNIKQEKMSSVSFIKDQMVNQHGHFIPFSLFDLPLEVQKIYQVLLMAPVGALIVLFLRNLIGIRTFGTFMPVLIAMAFRETHLLPGLALFSFIVSMGLIVRFYLERLHLLSGPRLGSVLSSVVIVMLVISILSYKLSMENTLSVALFPMVVITMTIERISLLWEERSPKEAIQQGIYSLFAASLAFAAMNEPHLKYWLFVFPELLFIVIAMMLLMGCYRGYRLTELLRFHTMNL
jgi:hypothetical protein